MKLFFHFFDMKIFVDKRSKFVTVGGVNPFEKNLFSSTNQMERKDTRTQDIKLLDPCSFRFLKQKKTQTLRNYKVKTLKLSIK